jgi:hypothetical protein
LHEISPKEKAEWYRLLDAEVLPELRDMFSAIFTGNLDPKASAFEFELNRWVLLMDWIEDHAFRNLLRLAKSMEPPATDVREHAAWEKGYKQWSDQFKGFESARAFGKVDTPEVVAIVVQIFLKAHHFTGRGLKFLRATERESLGEAERAPETEVILGPGDE